MEEQILEIIQKNAADSTLYVTDGLYHKIAVREIADHFREFIEWFHFGSHPFVPWWDLKGDKKVTWYTDEVSKHKFTFEEVYQYWCDNVLNLKQK